MIRGIMNGKDLQLTCLRISNHGLDPAKLPSRIKLLNWGENKTVKGPVVVGDETLAVLSVNQATRGFDRVALDYEHNTLKGTPAFKESKEPRMVAGYGVPVVVKGEGLFLDQMMYTPSGVENAREYIDLSPVVAQNDTGEVLFLHSAALCRQGAVEDLQFYNVELEEGGADSIEGLNAELQKMRKALRAVSEKIYEIERAVEKQANADALDELTANSVKDLSDQVTTLSTSFDEVRREQLIAAARAQGKKVPSDEVTNKLDLTALSALLNDLEPDRIPLQRRTPATVREHTVPEDSDESHAAAIRNRAHALQSQNPTWSFTRCFNAAEIELTKPAKKE